MVSDSVTTSVSVAPLTLTFVQPEELRPVWDFVRRGLGVVQEKTDAHWFVEDVYTHLRGGTAWLYVARRWNKPVGFCILTMTVNPFTTDKTAVIWITFTNEAGVVDDLLPDVERMCQAGGCTHVTFQSPRRGWQRRLAKQGYVLREYVFEKRLS